MNGVMNMRGSKLDVVLTWEGTKVDCEYVEGTELVPIDLYHPPLDIAIPIALHKGDDEKLDPSNIDQSRDWNFKKGDYTLLYDYIHSAHWHEVLSCNDASSATDKFYSIMYDLFNSTIPKKKRLNADNRRFPVWFTKDLITNLKQKIKLHNKWKRTSCERTYAKFNALRSDLKLRTQEAYKSYSHLVEKNIRKNPEQFWNYISNMRSKGGFEPNVTYKGESISGIRAADTFAQYFAGVFLPDMPKLDPSSLNLTADEGNYIPLPSLTPLNVEKSIEKLNPNASIGPDNIPNYVLKGCKRILATPLCHIFNLALRSGVYPKQLKVSRVTPIPKSSDKASVENHRPVAVLPTIAKVFEHSLHSIILKQINVYLSDAQHGFRPGRSVDTNLMIHVDLISKGLDSGTQVDVVYFDFRKAFDRVDNDVLLTKLCAIGLSPGFLNFFADYLRDRKQFVRHGCFESETYNTRSGVSQGSVLGPLLFLIMINDLAKEIYFAKYLLYADDLKLIMEVKTDDDCRRLQSDIDSIHHWSIKNKLYFNSDKCYVMSYSRRLHQICHGYTLDGQQITRVTNIKDLGVTFDKGLTFRDHISALAKESFRRLGFVLRNARDFDSPHVIKLLYNTLVRSKLEAGACVWNPYTATQTLMLEKVQKTFLRFLFKKVHKYFPYMYPTNYLFGMLGYNSLEVRRGLNQIAVACKTLRGLIDCPELHNLFCQLYVPGNYIGHRQSKRHKLFARPACRTVARAESPVCRTLEALNALLAVNPDCDLFADEWREIMRVCLKFCERKYERISTVIY